MATEPIKVLHYGLGPIGCAAARLALQKNNLQLVGGIDIDPEKVGKDLGEVLELGRKLGVEISDDPETVFEQTRPDIVLHCTGSFLQKLEEQFLTCLRGGASVISSCEELFYPYHRHPDLSQRLDARAKEHGLTVVGTGVNPGFSMDLLPVVLSGVCAEVSHVTAVRVVDASRRRLPLQKKIGAGLTPEVFRDLVRQGKLGHVGLVESLVAVAKTFGWELQDVQEFIDPKVAEKRVETPYLTVEPDQVAGILHTARGLRDDQEVLYLELQMYVGAEEPYDGVRIQGDPALDMRIDGGIFGDTATVARMVNAIPAVRKSTPGLKTVLDLPVQAFFA